MRVFVPFPDDWSGFPDLSQVKLVPYRAGVALCPGQGPGDDGSRRTDESAAIETAPMAVTARAA